MKIVNRQAKIGLFETKSPNDKKELLVFDFQNQKKNYLENYLEWDAKCISPNGERIIISTFSSYKRAERTDLVVMEHKNQNVLLNTHDYYVYDTEFNSNGNKILIVANAKKPFCYDLEKTKITAELPKQVRTYKGDLDLEKDVFVVPCEKMKDTCCLFDFNTGKTEIIKLGVKAVINHIKFSVDFSYVYAITEDNILYCFDRKFNIKWSKDFNYLGKKGGRITSDIYRTENGKYLAVYAPSTETNRWGAEYVIDCKNGEIVNQIEAFQFRGRFAAEFFDNKVLLYTFKTIDLTTGEICENPII
jgi:WD40 repeat protein